MNVISYSRVSGLDQNYDRQLADIKNYCKAYNYNILEDFYEKESGTHKERPALTEMLNYVKINQVDYVICSELSRLGRTSEVLNTISYLHELKTGVIFLKENMRTLNEDKSENPNNKLLTTVLSGINSFELDTIVYRLGSGLLKSAQSGNWFGYPYPYGYEKEKIPNSLKLVLCQKEAIIVKDIFNLYAQGIGSYTICRILNKKNITTTLNYKWTQGHIYNIITNSIYCGERIYKKNIIQVPPIISKEQFLNVQNIRKSKSDLDKRNDYLLTTKLIVCNVCGRYFGARDKMNNEKCKLYKCFGTGQPHYCKSTSISIEKLDFVIKYIYYTQLFGFVNIPEIKFIENKYNELDTCKIDLEKLNKKENKYLMLFANNSISRETLNINLDKINNRKLELQNLMESIKSYILHFSELKLKNICTKKYLRQVVKKIIIYKDETIHATLKDQGIKAVVIDVLDNQYELLMSQRSKYFIYNEEKIFYDFLAPESQLYPNIYSFSDL